MTRRDARRVTIEYVNGEVEEYLNVHVSDVNTATIDRPQDAAESYKWIVLPLKRRVTT